MKVEIITSSLCTACDGSGLVLNPRGGKLDCPNRCKRGVIVRKTTFADAAALRSVTREALWLESPAFTDKPFPCYIEEFDRFVAAVLAALGVSDDHTG